jgi:alkylation response protein AidB-like acyl-CoA dehydrogenase
MNYFTDNEDLRFVFETTDLNNIVRAYEDDFRGNDLYDYAPDSVEDAIDSYRRVLEVAGDISCRIIAPLSERIDTEPNILRDGKVIYSKALQEGLRALCQAELMGCTISRKYGGLNLPGFVFTMLVEIISQAEASIQNIFGLQGIGSIIEAFADEKLKEKYLPLFASGEVTGAMALTEAEAGSDLQKVKLRADQEPGGTWRLNGVKRFITNGGGEVLLVLARSEPGTTDGLGLSLFLCEGDSTVTVRRLEDKLGIHGSPTCELSFHDTPAYLIGERQRGLVTYVLALLNGARLSTAAQSIGIAQASFNEAMVYAHVRKQYGRRIEKLPPVAEMLTKMKVAIEASRVLAYETARIMDMSIGTVKRLSSESIEPAEKKQLRKDSKKFERLTMLLTSLSKYYCSEMSIWVTRDGMQVLGGSGYMRDYPVEKYYRDARITNIYEGTSQMQVLSAFRGILSGTMGKYFEELSGFDFPRQQAALEKKLQRGRTLLSQSVEFLNSRKDNQLMELYSRKIVDMATEILIGYLFLKQSLNSSRKLKIARMFINDLEPVLKMRASHIKNADKTCLKNYSLIVGPAK